jgi:hypothetical protein
VAAEALVSGAHQQLHAAVGEHTLLHGEALQIDNQTENDKNKSISR